MNTFLRTIRLPLALLAPLTLIACGGGGGSSSPPAPPPGPTDTIGGTVSGLTGTGLVLQKNGGDDLSELFVSRMVLDGLFQDALAPFRKPTE